MTYWFCLFGYFPSSGTAGSYGNSGKMIYHLIPTLAPIWQFCNRHLKLLLLKMINSLLGPKVTKNRIKAQHLCLHCAPEFHLCWVHCLPLHACTLISSQSRLKTIKLSHCLVLNLKSPSIPGTLKTVFLSKSFCWNQTGLLG